jgi:hypothetical protein
MLRRGYVGVESAALIRWWSNAADWCGDLWQYVVVVAWMEYAVPSHRRLWRLGRRAEAGGECRLGVECHAQNHRRHKSSGWEPRRSLTCDVYIFRVDE